jgi:hypothetical protein
MRPQIARHEFVEMPGGAFAGVDGVVAIGIGHHGEGFVVSDEFVDELFDALVVDVVVAGAVDEEEVALE